jgi:hypothetical protein
LRSEENVQILHPYLSRILPQCLQQWNLRRGESDWSERKVHLAGNLMTLCIQLGSSDALSAKPPTLENRALILSDQRDHSLQLSAVSSQLWLRH